jgi:aminoglycoside phosphotransferase (APT) family kinase protein
MSTIDWGRHFLDAGHASAQPIGAGMEGTVYRLGDGLVGKVWFDRDLASVEAMQAVYASAGAHALPFALPSVISVYAHAGRAVSIERELRGHRLKERLVPERRELDPRAVEAIAVVVAGVATIPGTEAMRALPVLGEAQPFYAPGQTWNEALVALTRRRLDRFGDQLAASVPGFAELAAALLAGVAELPPAGATLIHGDICPENILVDDDLRPTALLDFGFLSTCGDPAFDAALTPAITDMYGPFARPHERAVQSQMHDDPVRSAIYRGVYGALTSNAYDADGADGQFAFCVGLLRRPELREALGL